MSAEGTNYMGKAVASGVTMVASAGASWVDKLEQALRMGASVIAIISGGVMLWFFLQDRKQKRNKQNYETHNQENQSTG